MTGWKWLGIAFAFTAGFLWTSGERMTAFIYMMFVLYVWIFEGPKGKR